MYLPIYERAKKLFYRLLVKNNSKQSIVLPGRKKVKPGILRSTFHFLDMMLNNITSSISDSEAMCPEYKVVACTIRKSKGKYK